MDDLLLTLPPLLLCTALVGGTYLCWQRRRRARGLLPADGRAGSVQDAVGQLTARAAVLQDQVAIELHRRAELRDRLNVPDPIRAAELIVFEEFLRATNPRP